MAEAGTTGKWSAFLRHPLAPMVVGFLLTGVVGSWLSNYYTNQQRQAEVAKQDRIKREKVLQQFAQMFGERNAQAELLMVAIKQRASKADLLERMRLYSNVYADWQSNRLALILLVRDLLQPVDFQTFQTSIAQSMEENIYAPLRTCILNAYDQAIAAHDAGATLQACRASKLLDQSRACGDTVANVLYELIELSERPPAAAEKETLRQKAANLLNQMCP